MSRFSCNSLTRITVFLCFLGIVIQVSRATTDLDDEDDKIFLNQNKPFRRKSARMAFLEESDDPMFKFLTKILNTAQLRTKNRMARAQNGIKQTQDLKTTITNELMKNQYFQ
ncbi:uncharacterized protein LOC123676384 [Harmonia axyridis]|uniref:uncharacterized protein LOC123676384 n=1 Tax=Harmonia axyridis TaxID=115357 RepID=UPI001E275F32|nr:uncharacterized protein LOC123676384 [Harmonia axyridis]